MPATPIPDRIRRIIERGNKLWADRANLESMWQEIANNFYPERADFTSTRNIGTDYAANLTTSFPLLCRRELGDTFSGMLRPNKDWFDMHTMREDRERQPDKAWLETQTKVQRRAMYDIESKFIRATKEADHDFASFGNCVIRPTISYRKQCLIYKCVHLRDCVWSENADGDIDEAHRKWKLEANLVVGLFPKTASADLIKLAKEKPNEIVELRHISIPADRYEAPAGARWGQKWVSIMVDVKHMAVLEEVPSWRLGYIISRWVTVSGSQYGTSPATTLALPDARLLQAMLLSLLEAGEKAANPPHLYVEQALRSDMNTMAGGATAVDIEFDGKLNEAMAPLNQDMRGFPIGEKLWEKQMEGLKEAFYLNMLKPFTPTDDPEMTAFQAGQIVQDYIRKALPLFEPMETDYNGKMCVDTAGLLLRNGVFGSIQDAPPTIQKFLRGGQLQFKFTSPLTAAIDADKGQKLVQMKGMIAQVMDVYPGAPGMGQWSVALRDALNGIATPAGWLASEDQVAQSDQAHAAAAQAGPALDLAGKAANVGKTLADAAASSKAGGLAPGGVVDTQPVA